MEIGDFNPNAALENLLKRSRKILVDYADTDGNGIDQEEAASLAEYVICLDAFLRKHDSAYLPAAWIKPESIKCDYCENRYLSEPGRTGIRLCAACERPVDANPNRQGLPKEKTS